MTLEEKYRKQIKGYYDPNGRLVQFPSKKPLREMALAKIAQGFDEGRNYTEKEVNAIIQSQIVFSDVELVRRELFQTGWLDRLRDGSQYWKPHREEP